MTPSNGTVLCDPAVRMVSSRSHLVDTVPPAVQTIKHEECFGSPSPRPCLRLHPAASDRLFPACRRPAPRSPHRPQHPLLRRRCSVLAAFFAPKPSFLRFQRQIEHRRRNSNCRTLFGMRSIPSDNCIRNLLDGVGAPPSSPSSPPCSGCCASAAASALGRILVALDAPRSMPPTRSTARTAPVARVARRLLPRPSTSTLCSAPPSWLTAITLHSPSLPSSSSPKLPARPAAPPKNASRTAKAMPPALALQAYPRVTALPGGLPRRRPVLLPAPLEARPRQRRRLPLRREADLPPALRRTAGGLHLWLGLAARAPP